VEGEKEDRWKMKSFKRFLGEEEEQEPSITEQLDDCFSLSMKNRLIGFAVCAGIGLAISIISCFFIPALVTGNPAPFAILYTFGNIFMMSSTIFLVGPWRQLKNMLAPTRLIATIIYFAAMIMTLVAAFVVKSALLVIIFLIIQAGALTWYTLSYVPGARFVVKKCLGGLV